MNPNIKRYVVSSMTTFLAMFTLSFGALVQTPGFTLSSSAVKGAVVAASLVAIRAVWKLIVEALSNFLADQKTTA